jgi:hypothetical protein
VADNEAVKGLHAMLTDKDKANNDLVIGAVNTVIVEDFTPPPKLEAGKSFTKDVKVNNVGPTACFVRIKAVFTDSDMEKLCTVDWNTTDFIYNEQDGFWYYPHVLESNDGTPSLFTTVTVKTTIKQSQKQEDGSTVEVDVPVTEAMLKDFDIIIYQEAFQAVCTDKSYTVDENEYFVNYQDAWAKYRENHPDNKTNNP